MDLPTFKEKRKRRDTVISFRILSQFDNVDIDQLFKLNINYTMKRIKTKLSKNDLGEM